MARYPLVGGPCDGQQSINFTVRPFAGYQTLCGTHLYTFRADGAFHDAGLDPALGEVPALDPRQFGRAWHKLMHALAVEAPHAIRQARAQGARAKRVVR